MRRYRFNIRRIPLAVLAGALQLGGLTAGAHVLATTAHRMPLVGDIVAFTATPNGPTAAGTRVIVHRRDQFGCVLDVNVLRGSGGSLVIEGRIAHSSSFHVHWAGPRTTADFGNCGTHADLVLDDRDLDALALAAGGYSSASLRPSTLSDDPAG